MKFEEYTPQQAFDHLLGKEIKRIGWPRAFGNWKVIAIGTDFVYLEQRSIELDGEYINRYPFTYKQLLEEFQLENKPVGMYNMEDSDHEELWEDLRSYYDYEGYVDEDRPF